jgi:xylulose-5-phosphate/fructose-6-phosphate phosphoketolase
VNPSTAAAPQPSAEELESLVAWWEAANYLTVAQIYLRENPLLREPLSAEHIKPRLLGHWGTSPALNLIYAHLNRLISTTGQDVLYVTGPGHGGPAIVASVYLEGTYSEIYPDISLDESGLRRLVRQFSTPGGIPSHVSVNTPGSIHEGGELGYSLAHAFGAAFDHPDLLVACVVGDGEAETGPLEASWKGVRFLNPERDGAVLPILQLNEAKISGPTVLGRATEQEISELLRGHGYAPAFVEGSDSGAVHADFARELATAYARIAEIQRRARSEGVSERPVWPAIVLRTPKGWTGPEEVDGVQVEGTFRSHQVPLPRVREIPEHLAQLEAWMRSYRPERNFNDRGAPVDEIRALAPAADKRMGSSPYANGGRLLEPLRLPALETLEADARPRGATRVETTRPLGNMLASIYRDNPGRFRLFCPDETNSNRLGAVFEREERCLMDAREDDEQVSPRGRVMEVLSEHLCEGWLEGYLLSGRHGLFATYEAFGMVSASMTIQHAKWLAEAETLAWREKVASLNVLLTSTCWRNDHNGFSHQGPGLIDSMISLRASVVRIYLPPDANSLLSVAEHCFERRNYVNLIVADKQNHLQYLNLEEAREHAAAGASSWDWAGHEPDDPEIVLGCAGDVPTMETLAAAALLREHLPELRFRVVNVIDLMAVSPPDIHPHGLSHEHFEQLFGRETEVVMAFHGYARALHQLLHGRIHPGRFHVRGYNEQGTTTTPFDMVVLNRMSRYHLVEEVLNRVESPPLGAKELRRHCSEMLAHHHEYVREHFEDVPAIRDWVWRD